MIARVTSLRDRRERNGRAAGPVGAGETSSMAPKADNYRWIALSNVTLGVLLATLDGSITLIAMPDIFRGIRLDPLVPANSFYLLWMILGFLVVTSVLIVSFGRLGDMYGRVRMYNLGFVIYTVSSLALTVDWMTGPSGALYLIVWRIVQGIQLDAAEDVRHRDQGDRQVERREQDREGRIRQGDPLVTVVHRGILYRQTVQSTC